MTTSKATHYHCACEDCYWGIIVESSGTAADAVVSHAKKTGNSWETGHSWTIEGLFKAGDGGEEGQEVLTE